MPEKPSWYHIANVNLERLSGCLNGRLLGSYSAVASLHQSQAVL